MEDRKITIWYNPECSKCRDARDLAGAEGCDIQIREYLQQAPSREELTALLDLLAIPAADLVRKGEPLFQELYEGRELSNDEWIEVLVTHPELMERPVIIYGDKAVIGRPPSRILDLLKGA